MIFMPAALHGLEASVFFFVLLVVVVAVGVTAVLGLVKLIECGWFPAVVRALTGIGGIACGVAGFMFLTNINETDDTAGAVLAVGGLCLFAVSAMRVWESSATQRRGVTIRTDRGEL